MMTGKEIAYWEHFDHDADIGIRGIAPTLAECFAQAALALTAVVTEPDGIHESVSIEIKCQATDMELLFLDWINELIYQMSAHHLLFRCFEVTIKEHGLTATAMGEIADQKKHHPVIEVKGATFTELRVYQSGEGMWIAQCIIDV